MDYEISQQTKDVMAALDSGSAYDRSLQDNIASLNSGFSSIVSAKTDYATSMGMFSPTMLNFTNIEQSIDTKPITSADVSSMDFGPDLTSDEKSALRGLPRGATALFQSHVQNHFDGLTDNMNVYASSQAVHNALGTSQGCGGLADHFGSIMHIGQSKYQGYANSQSTITQAFSLVKSLQGQNSAAISAHDTSIIGLLSGKINPTILAQAVKGTGLYDQIDGLLSKGGFSGTSQEAQAIKTAAQGALTTALTQFYNQKSSVNNEVGGLASKKNDVFSMVGKEMNAFTQATTVLRSLGSANAVQGMFKSNPCIQALLGFVATPSFLGKLG